MGVGLGVGFEVGLGVTGLGVGFGVLATTTLPGAVHLPLLPH